MNFAGCTVQDITDKVYSISVTMSFVSGIPVCERLQCPDPTLGSTQGVGEV